MNRRQLRLVASNNARDAARAAAVHDFIVFAHQVRRRLASCGECVVYAWGVLMLPLRAIAAVWRFTVGVGLAIIDGVMRLFLAALGLGVLTLAYYMVHQFIARS